MIKKINPLYLLLLFSSIMIVILFNVNIKQKELNKSNMLLSKFHQQLNDYLFYNKHSISKNMSIKKIKTIIEEELSKDLNFSVKTLEQHVQITIKFTKQNVAIPILDVFYKSGLKMTQVKMDKENLFIKIKV